MIASITSLSEFSFDEKYQVYKNVNCTDGQNIFEMYVTLPKGQQLSEKEIVVAINSLIDWLNINYSKVVEYVLAEMRPVYNKHWNDNQKEIDEQTFRTNLLLKGIDHTINGTTFIYLACGNLFLGHDIEVRIDNKYSFVEAGLVG